MASDAKILRKKMKGKTKYKCPFCSYKNTKYYDILHIEEHHKELIPEGFTAARLFFNKVNKVEKGSCIMCGNETRWNEDTWRYERLCDNPKCKTAYLNKMKKGMVNRYGKTTLLNDPKHQDKMLKHRSISGDYTFKDGGVRQYVGSYEKNLLEYFDNQMNTKSKDIYTPGPTIMYTYKGKKHFWITDVYYVPANLIIEVKDGGDNPNTREMVSYREKQLAKEKALSEMDKYNYIRLTNNNFLEFTKTLDDIKSNLENENEERVFNVLEMSLASINPTIGMDSPNNRIYMVNTTVNDRVINTGFGKDLNNIKFLDKDKRIKNINIKDIKSDYNTSYIDDDNIYENFENTIKEFSLMEEIEFSPIKLYDTITESKSVSLNQPIFDNRFTKFIDEVKSFKYTKLNSLKVGKDTELAYSESLECMDSELDKIKSVLEQYDNINVKSHYTGYIIYNESNGLHSEVFNTLDDISKNDLDRISGGKINE